MNSEAKTERAIIASYECAKERYAELSVDVDAVMRRIDAIPLSVHCWQGDDVGGFEHERRALSGGIQATGNYPGKPRSISEFRADVEEAFRFIPGKKKFNLHALYLDCEKSIGRDEIEPEHFASWVAWARAQGVGLDFNPSCFSHPLSKDDMTLSHPQKAVRDFWVEHVRRSRRISAFFGEQLGQRVLTNIWIPDGFKDTPVDRLGPRQRLAEALDACLEETLDARHCLDVVESKLFGIGSESYVVGSHEFYMLYAMKKGIALCMDTGHFHPTEMVSNKLSAAALFFNDLLLHISRPVRWDSDHVVALDEELIALAQEIMRHGLEEKIHLGLDFFDASINRIAAWVVGARNVKKALLIAALEPTPLLMENERKFDFTKRLVYQEELKGYPW